MANSNGFLPPTLQPWNRTAGEPKSFAAALGRIYAERGHFRHITETKLREELAVQAVTGVSSPSGSDIEEPEPKDPSSRADQLAQARREAIEHVASAQNEALLALDFISLLLSKDVKQAESTISPILKQAVPPGTLGLDMWAGMTPDAKQEETDRLLARGKRMESLTQGADALMAAGDRLRSTVDRERKYWDEVLRVREKGWNLCRMPRERGTLGVRYGFAEAQGEYARRGLAALKMDRAGNVTLDRGLGIQAKALRVRILQGGNVIGENSARLSYKGDEDGRMDVEARIRSARDSLFEEELWHEAMRESRTLGSHGVRMKGNTISVPLAYLDTQDPGHDDSNATTIEIDLVTADSEMTGHSSMLADGVATSLRLLLSHAHRTRLEKRSIIPPPMSATKMDRPVAEILRPLLSALHHHSAMTKLHEQVSRVSALLEKAHVGFSQETTHALADKLESSPTAAALLASFCQAQTSEVKLSISLPADKDSASPPPLEMTIKVSTWLSPPLSRGTTFSFSSPGLRSFDRSTSSLSVMAGHLSAALQSAFTDAIGAWLPSWTRDPVAGSLERPTLTRSGGVDSLTVRMAKEREGLGLTVRAGAEEVSWITGGAETRAFAEVVTEMCTSLA